MKVLVTCPPMLRRIDDFRPAFAARQVELELPNVVQALTERQLLDLVPQCDGWIIGDDPATEAVFAAGKSGRLKAAVKWGVGTNNVDVAAAARLGIPVTNTPRLFGREVGDLAMAYLVAIARDLVFVDRSVRAGEWPKPSGISLAWRTVGLVGYGDIGRNIARRLLAADMRVIVYDPAFDGPPPADGITLAEWPDRVDEADFLVFACSLTPENRHMLDSSTLARTKRGVRVVNVARGPLIDERALIAALDSGHVESAALDVFEDEPLPAESPLRHCGRCVFGSHNASNTVEAVTRASREAMRLLFGFLGVGEETS
jgi:phosphoglycerate dehydrogenase-like enzyme